MTPLRLVARFLSGRCLMSQDEFEAWREEYIAALVAIGEEPV